MSRPSTAGWTSCSRRRSAPPRSVLASIGPWASPPVPVLGPGGECCLNWAKEPVFQRDLDRDSRATTADHSKLSLARLYGGAPFGVAPRGGPDVEGIIAD